MDDVREIPRVLVLGAGVAGTRAALYLEELSQKGEVEIVVVNEKYYHLLIPNLHEAATNRISAKAVLLSLEEIFRDKNIILHCAKVTGINLDEKYVIASGKKISYDFLVIALGGRANYYNIPGLTEYAMPLRTLEDAEAIKNHILEMFKLGVKEQDGKKKKELLTFVVGGIGAAGTQFATELADWITDLRAHYDVSQDGVRIVAVEAMETMGIDRPLVRYAYKILKEKGIKLIFGSAIQSVDKNTIYLSNGKRIRTRTLVWTGGLKGHELIEKTGFQVNHQKRAKVNGYLEAMGHEGVFVIGDASVVFNTETGNPMIPSAQMALNEATYVVEHLISRIRKKPLYEYKPHRRGVAISLGRKDGASIVYQFRLLGRIGKFFKIITEIRYFYMLGGLRQIIEGYRLRSHKMNYPSSTMT